MCRYTPESNTVLRYTSKQYILEKSHFFSSSWDIPDVVHHFSALFQYFFLVFNNASTKFAGTRNGRRSNRASSSLDPSASVELPSRYSGEVTAVHAESDHSSPSHPAASHSSPIVFFFHNALFFIIRKYAGHKPSFSYSFQRIHRWFSFCSAFLHVCKWKTRIDEPHPSDTLFFSSTIEPIWIKLE